MRLSQIAALVLMLVTACGDDGGGDDDAASGVEGLYLFPCDDDDPSCDVEDGIWLEDGRVYSAYAARVGELVCREDANGTYEVTATGIRVMWFGDDESPPSEEDVAIVDGVLRSGDRPERVSGKRRLGSKAECSELDS